MAAPLLAGRVKQQSDRNSIPKADAPSNNTKLIDFKRRMAKLMNHVVSSDYIFSDPDQLIKEKKM